MTKCMLVAPYGELGQCLIVEKCENKDHFTLIRHNNAEYWVKNDFIINFFESGEEVFVKRGDIFILGTFIHHSGPDLCLVKINKNNNCSEVCEVLLSDVFECKLSGCPLP